MMPQLINLSGAGAWLQAAWSLPPVAAAAWVAAKTFALVKGLMANASHGGGAQDAAVGYLIGHDQGKVSEQLDAIVAAQKETTKAVQEVGHGIEAMAKTLDRHMLETAPALVQVAELARRAGIPQGGGGL